MKFSGRMHGVIEAEKKCMLTCVGLGSDCFIADFAGKEDIAVGRLRIGCSTAGQGVDPLQGQGGLGGRHSCGRYSRRRLPIKQHNQLNVVVHIVALEAGHLHTMLQWELLTPATRQSGGLEFKLTSMQMLGSFSKASCCTLLSVHT